MQYALYDGWNHMTGWSWAWMLIGWALFAALIVLAAWLFRGDGATSPAAPTAMDILDKRYARGEIARETYLQQRRDLAE